MSSKQGRAWCVTVAARSINVMDLKKRLEEMVERGKVKYVVMGKLEEGGRTGYQHYHLYIEMVNKCAMSTLKQTIGVRDCHAENRFGKQEDAIGYAIKEGVEFELGKKDEQGKRSDLLAVKKLLEEGKDLVDIAYDDTHFGTVMHNLRSFMYYQLAARKKRAKEGLLEAPEVIVYVGKSGTGKSWHCRNDPDYIKSGFKFMVQQSGKCYFDGYAGESTIWFDEFSGSTIEFNKFLQLADMYEFTGEIKGGAVDVFRKKILISTTVWPFDWWPNVEKFRRDPLQLWRRITKLYWIPARYSDPVEIHKEKREVKKTKWVNGEKVTYMEEEEHYDYLNEHFVRDLEQRYE